jgi:DNA-binding transcriptional MerR regulator
MDSFDSLRSGELARAAGVSRDTLRHYERKGVLAKPHRSPNNYRLYPRQALVRLGIIRGALAIGLTLEELAEVFKTRERGGTPCRKVRGLAAARLVRVEEAIRNLSAQRDILLATLRAWDRLLSRTAPGKRAGLLESLIPIPGGGHRPAVRPILILSKRSPHRGERS